jgi:transposase InsO family protein
VSISDRKHLSGLIEEAVSLGARRNECCKAIALSLRTLQRWERDLEIGDQRRGPTTVAAHQLSAVERQAVIDCANSSEYQNLPPSQIVPSLADRGIYLASESTFYRILKKANLATFRLNTHPRVNKRPQPLVAVGANQIWSWDITYLKSPVKGLYYYLYLIMDIYSRMIVGWEIYEYESSDLSAALIAYSTNAHGVRRDQLTLHADNGGPMKGATMLSTLQKLGVIPSFSRPSVSDDNPFSESLFKTLKYRPSYPDGAFASLIEARTWVAKFVEWYNTKHLHSEIRYVTPECRHYGRDQEVLIQRTSIYETAKQKNPLRWAGKTRKWTQIKEVQLNPTREMRETLKIKEKIAA